MKTASTNYANSHKLQESSANGQQNHGISTLPNLLMKRQHADLQSLLEYGHYLQ